MKVLVLAMALLAGGCVRVTVGGDGEPPRVWAVDPPPVAAATPTRTLAQLNPFTSAPAYEASAMVLVTAEGKLVRASRNRWEAPPAEVLGTILWRDLVTSGVVKSVHRRVRGSHAVVVDGHILEFGARQRGSAWCAVIDMTLTVSSQADRFPPLQRRLRFEQPLEESSFSAVASAMRPLARQWADSVLATLVRVGGARAEAPAPKLPGPRRGRMVANPSEDAPGGGHGPSASPGGR